MGPSPGDEGNCASRKPSSVKAQNTAPAMNVAGAAQAIPKQPRARAGSEQGDAAQQLERLPSLESVGPATMRRDFGSPRPRCGERSVRLPARRERAPNIARPRYGDQAMLAKLRPAVHDSMTDGGQSRHVGVGEELCDADDRFPLATYGYGLVDRLVSAEVLRGELSVLLADRLGLAGKRHFGPRRCHAVQTELERGRATVQREHVQIGSRVSRSTSRPRPRPCAHGVQRQSSTSGMSSPCSLM